MTGRIIAAMPAHNEERHIGTMVLEANRYVDEVIVIDDGSTDNTSEVARLAGASVISHHRNKGYGVTVRHILAEGKERKAGVLVLLDADGQHNPAEIPRAVELILAGYDVAVGSRRLQKNDIPPYRLWGQNILTMLTRLISYKRLTDSESGFRAFSGKALSTIHLEEDGMAVGSETLVRAFDNGLSFTEFPISVSYRAGRQVR